VFRVFLQVASLKSGLRLLLTITVGRKMINGGTNE